MKRRLVGVCKVSAIVCRGGVSLPDWEILLAKSTVPAAPEMYAAAQRGGMFIGNGTRRLTSPIRRVVCLEIYNIKEKRA